MLYAKLQKSNSEAQILKCSTWSVSTAACAMAAAELMRLGSRWRTWGSADCLCGAAQCGGSSHMAADATPKTAHRHIHADIGLFIQAAHGIEVHLGWTLRVSEHVRTGSHSGDAASWEQHPPGTPHDTVIFAAPSELGTHWCCIGSGFTQELAAPPDTAIITGHMHGGPMSGALQRPFDRCLARHQPSGEDGSRKEPPCQRCSLASFALARQHLCQQLPVRP